MLLSFPVFAGSKHIVPADKSKISRNVGESVVVECKNLSPFSTNCQVDCGNGRRFNKAKGYCYYLTKGNYLLKVSTRHRGKEYQHTASVSILEKKKVTNISSRPVNSSPASISNTSVDPQRVTATNLKNAEKINSTSVERSISQTSSKSDLDILPSVTSSSTISAVEDNAIGISVTQTEENLITNQLGTGNINNNFNQDNNTSGTGFGRNSSNVNQNGIQDQFVQRP